MGCGVSKKNITEPSRLQTVVVNAASPQSHLKAHEANLQQNHGLICLIGTQCQWPSNDGLDNSSSNNEPKNSPLQISACDLNGCLHPLLDCAQEYDSPQKEDMEDLPQSTPTSNEPCDKSPPLLTPIKNVPCDENPWLTSTISIHYDESPQKEDKENLPQSTPTSNKPCDKSPPGPLLTPIKNVPCDENPWLTSTISIHYDESPQIDTRTNVPCYETPRAQQNVIEDSPLFCSSNGLVGTLASLDEILGAQEEASLKFAIKVTAEKIMSYGGVLHSLEDQVGGVLHSLEDQVEDFKSPLACNKDDVLVQLSHQAKEEEQNLGSSIGNHDRIQSPTLTISSKPAFENFRKKLPPILTTPSSSLIDKSLIGDPFAKTLPPIYSKPRMVETTQDSTEEPPPSSPQLPHTTKFVGVENVKDNLVMDGASCSSEQSGSPSCKSLSGGQQYDVHDLSTLQETLEFEAQESTHGCYDPNMHPSCQSIIVSSLNLISHFEEKDALKASSPLFSTSSCRIECLEDCNMKPLSSEEFYS